MEQSPTRGRPGLPLKLHAVRLVATAVVFSVFRWRRLTRLRIFRAAMAYLFGRLAGRYEAMGARLPGGWETLSLPLREALGDHLVGPPPRRFLDLACGTARASRLVLERFPGAEVFALDVALPMLREARRLWPKEGPALLCVAADAASPPFAPGSFDLVVVMNAPPEPEAVVKLLAPGGRVVFAYSFPYTPLVRPQLRRRLEAAGFALASVRPSGLGVLAIARNPEGPKAVD